MSTKNDIANNKDSKVKKDLIRLIIKVCVMTLVVIILLVFIVGIYPVHGNTMYPMIKDGDLVFTLKTGEYQRGQVVAYKYGNELRYARIVGISGDSIHIDETDYLVNSQMPAEEVFFQTVSQVPIDVVLNEKEVYLLNDHREDVRDSRTYGAISKDSLRGYVVFSFRWRGF